MKKIFNISFAAVFFMLGVFLLPSHKADAAPSVNVTATPSSVASGGYSWIKWSSTGATACYKVDSSGNVISSVALNDSTGFQVGPMYSTTTYYIKCTAPDPVPTTTVCYRGFWQDPDPVHPDGGRVTYTGADNVSYTESGIWDDRIAEITYKTGTSPSAQGAHTVSCPTGTWSYTSACPTTCGYSGGTQTQTCTGGNSICDGPASSRYCGATAACASACSSYYPTCFISDTLVIMSDGSTKNIQDVKVGDILKGEKTNNTVLGLHRPELNGKLYSFNDGRYFVTEEHPFKTTDGWKSINPKKTALENIGIEVFPLEVGDTLITENGNLLLKSINSKEGKTGTDLFNFLLDGDHTYYADGYLVHNKQQCLLPDNTISCGSNDFCVLSDGTTSTTGGVCPMACNSSTYVNGTTGCNSGYTSICNGTAIQCVTSSCASSEGYCAGTVIGSSPQTYEGESCSAFDETICGTSWLTHGCHWVAS